MKKVTLYTDGSCLGNGTASNKGGYAAILKFGEATKEISGGELNTTNNRMEIMAVLVGLKALKCACEVEVYSDSAYVVGALNGWIAGWQRNCWLTSQRKPVENSDLWKEVAALMAVHTVKAIKVAGHAGDQMNTRADALAVSAAYAL